MNSKHYTEFPKVLNSKAILTESVHSLYKAFLKFVSVTVVRYSATVYSLFRDK